MKLRLETCRPLVYKIGWLKEQGKDATLEAAMAKLHVSECFVQNSLDAVQLFGAAGFADRDRASSATSATASAASSIRGPTTSSATSSPSNCGSDLKTRGPLRRTWPSGMKNRPLSIP